MEGQNQIIVKGLSLMTVLRLIVQKGKVLRRRRKDCKVVEKGAVSESACLGAWGFLCPFAGASWEVRLCYLWR